MMRFICSTQTSFKDKEETTETLSSSSYLITNVNSEPSGAIAITGTPTENQTLPSILVI